MLLSLPWFPRRESWHQPLKRGEREVLTKHWQPETLFIFCLLHYCFSLLELFYIS